MQNEPLPALSSPNPDGHEIEYIDMYIARYDLLSRETPGVPTSATAAATESRRALVELRDAVDSGTPLSSMLAENYANSGELFAVLTKFGDEASAICP